MTSQFDPGGFSNVDASGSPGQFSACLDRAGAIAAIVENRRLVREGLAIRPGDAVLDVGSGNGGETNAIAELVGPTGRVVGVDLSSTLVEEARRRTPESVANLEFIVADAHALPFQDDEFDAVRTERTLQHVERVELVAREMIRVVRPGGRVAAWEPDWGLTFISGSDRALSAAVTERVVGSVRNPRIGRNLAALLGRAGLSEISVAARVGLWETLDAVEERIGLRALVRELVADEMQMKSRAERWLIELEEDAAAGRLVAGVCGFVVSGQKL